MGKMVLGTERMFGSAISASSFSWVVTKLLACSFENGCCCGGGHVEAKGARLPIGELIGRPA